MENKLQSRRTQKCVRHQIEKQISRVENKSRVKEHQSLNQEVNHNGVNKNEIVSKRTQNFKSKNKSQ